MSYLNILSRAAKSPVIDYHLRLLKNPKFRHNFFNKTIVDILTDLNALEEVLSDFECRYAPLSSEMIYHAYMHGEEPEDDGFVSDFGEWAGAYRIWLSCLSEYEDEMKKLSQQLPQIKESLLLAA